MAVSFKKQQGENWVETISDHHHTHLRSNFFNVLEEYKITYTEVVPSVLFLLNKLKVDIRKLDLSSLEFIGCGSSTLPISAQKEFIKRYKIGIGNLYGLSETGPSHIDDPRKKNWKPGSIGVPLDVNKCKIKILSANR